MITAIIFDFWETLGTKNVGISKSLQQQFDIPKGDDFSEKYEKAVQLHPWENEEQMARNFLLEFGVDQIGENIQFVTELFKKGVDNASLFDGIKDLLVSLKEKGFRLGLLSNTTIFESTVLKNLQIADLFDAVVFSWHKGNLKPSLESFEHILSELKLSKDQVIFIDDTKKNISAAEQYGIRSIRFESVLQLLEELKKIGIL
ncbi:MAG: HAD-IA family hydrolase [Parcubacteria group bacterium]|nr:HAD-IA family hydrolase [Parcubacteria group bacterium]